MGKKRSILILLAVFALGVTSCSRPQVEPGKGVQAAPNAVGVKVASVSKGDIASSLSYTGDIKAKTQISVIPRVSGRIDDLKVDVGAKVKEGEVIALLEHASLDAQLQQANANLETAKARYDQVANPSKSSLDTAMAALKKSEAGLKLAQKNYDLVSYRGDIEAMPQATALEQATLDYEIALATYNLKTKPSDQDIAIVKASVSQAEAAVTLAKNQLKEATIVAPVSGIVTERLLVKGATAAPTTPIVIIMSTDVEIAVSIEESRFAEVKEGQEATIKVASYPGETFTGKVESIAPTSDPKSRTFTAKVVPVPQDGKLRPGMYAEVGLQTQQRNATLLVPKEAVITKNNRIYVFTVADGKAKSKTVRTGLSDSKIVEVLDGLAQSDEVIITGHTNLNDEDLVTPERVTR